MKKIMPWTFRSLLYVGFLTLIGEAVAAAPGDIDGDGKSDFTVARTYSFDGCYDSNTPSWANCFDGNLTQRISWFTLQSGDARALIRSVAAASSDGAKGLVLDPSTTSDSTGAIRLLRQNHIGMYHDDDIKRFGADNDFCEFQHHSCFWQDGSKSDSSLSVQTFRTEVGASIEGAQQVAALFLRLDSEGEKLVSVIRSNESLIFAPPRALALPANVASLVFPAGIPVPEDYNGDGVDELAVWSRDTAEWIIRNYGEAAETRIQWGLPGDHPMPGDYDGDHKADIAVWRPSTGYWFILTAASGFARDSAQVVQFGLPRAERDASGDKPVRADFDGDGKLDLAIFRPPSGTWFYRSSRDGVVYSVQWGLPGDLPIGMGIVDRMLFLE